MTSYSLIFLKIFLLFILSGEIFALYSLKSTASSGYYRDRKNLDHVTTFFDFQYHYLDKSGVEGFLDLGLNNNFLQDTWGVYPQQFNINVPLDNGVKNAPYYKSRIIVGRQLLTEGFEVDLLDGLMLPYYFSADVGVISYAGVLHVLEQARIVTSDQIYGTSLLLRKWDLTTKMGPVIKSREGSERFLGHMSVMKDFGETFLSPIIFVKTQFDLGEMEHDQSLAEAQLFYKKFQGVLSYSSRRPDRLLRPERNFIYSLVAIDNQESVGTAISWDNERDLTLGHKVNVVNFTSSKGKESGMIQELNGDWRKGAQKISPFLTMISSFGGEYYQGGANYIYVVDDFREVNVEFDVARCDKINGIEAWLYHSQVGMNYNFWKRWKALLSVEGERNHLFDFNLKAVVYVTYFQY
ncbi:MAG: hypothetical protein A2504_01285 [Bdellovibrionales bacterium RIFOXYD12_FULL_39_22]|nr:MAG: hypothetical protein A2385_02175 [Bdellovibrionales bacterium RIFOXYB1_FULL_39_21]OFZ42741.1 MAG: hypothetical protein A2485_10360 [Bdellovibrionales bacterium RIFOXYC12_FULL_39_17]OFZ47300.1 MAG: hypothetical protein A2404_14965 [Bdellovibrionales bacterium RIFOXYC1_FULL_39_130]OFZ75466.1 MAG: hypothetical protein A2560_04235 [Bdellovibrionales bacterium RIFOXYD1_FULL_39_84]OFZ93420.1 MAG: hypothetical protein A2504_01285 [Bdellovibrionales bacterium RIFOXYD12_FULL_39_22]HLE12392.1 hy